MQGYHNVEGWRMVTTDTSVKLSGSYFHYGLHTLKIIGDGCLDAPFAAP